MTKIGEQVQEALQGLKDFQLATVDYLYDQYIKNARNKMLVADEVGLGKTIVAKGLIAKLVENHISNRKRKPFKVIYICSNQNIASQNIGKLNFLKGELAENVVEYRSSDDRLTALAYEPEETVRKSRLKIRALTPATSFSTGTSAGRKDERKLIFRLLLKHNTLKQYSTHLIWMMVGREGNFDLDKWKENLKDSMSKNPNCEHRKIRKKVYNSFHRIISKTIAPKEYLQSCYDRAELENDVSYLKLIRKLCKVGVNKRTFKKDIKSYQKLISKLRILLSECCKEYLKGDLFVLDEFQRYSKILESKESNLPGEQIAYSILNNKKNNVLMLSATPFKPYTSNFDEANGENHYVEFKKILKFLLNEEDDLFWSKYEDTRKRFFDFIRHPEKIRNQFNQVRSTKDQLEIIYRSCMVRTERMTVSKGKDAMIKSSPVELSISKEDIEDFIAIDNIVAYMNENYETALSSPIEYVKSTPFAFSFLNEYQHLKKLRKYIQNDKLLKKRVLSNKRAWLNEESIREFKTLEQLNATSIPNSKLRLLIEKTMNHEEWKLLWLPPTISYYEPKQSHWKNRNHSKLLIFSAWKLVPRMISTLLSYEMERKAMKGVKDVKYFNESNSFSQPMKFDFKDGEPRSINAFMLWYPSIYLAHIYDPQSNLNQELSITDIRKNISLKITAALKKLKVVDKSGKSSKKGNVSTWLWMAIIKLDRGFDENYKSEELKQNKDPVVNKYIDFISELEFDLEKVGLIPGNRIKNVVGFLTDLCIGGPGICIYRSLSKIYLQEDNVANRALSSALGFRTLFNKRIPNAIVEKSITKNRTYYRKVLTYCIEGNIQAMLDEYFYMLFDSNTAKNAEIASNKLLNILTVKSTTLDVNSLNLDDADPIKSMKLRTHMSVGFGQQKHTNESKRPISIRDAFNSPFRPFVMTSTSIGQEGLDFHFYCRRIMHWNLPSNPVDLEQREGRIHRFKGLVIRQNLAKKYSKDIKNLKGEFLLWNEVFKLAEGMKGNTGNDMIPFWHVEPADDIMIERIVPLYPFSKDVDRFDQLQKILFYYRLTFGQPRQDELIQSMNDNAIEDIREYIDQLVIDLSPVNFTKTNPQ